MNPMRVCYRALFLIAIILAAPALCAAQVYVSDYYSGYIWSYADTVGTVINPEFQYWSPNGNYLPSFASPEGGRGDFSYVDISTESVYSMLIQVDVYFPGSRLFYVH